MKVLLDLCAYRDATKSIETNLKKIDDIESLKEIKKLADLGDIEIFLCANNRFEERKGSEQIIVKSNIFWGNNIKFLNQFIGFSGALILDNLLLSLDASRITFYENKLHNLKNIINNPKMDLDLSIIINGEYFDIPFFITTDYKLINSIKNYINEFKIQVLRPINFLELLNSKPL